MSSRYGYDPSNGTNVEYTPAQLAFYKKALKAGEQRYGKMGRDPSSQVTEYARAALAVHLTMHDPSKNYLEKDDKGNVTSITINGVRELLHQIKLYDVHDLSMEDVLGMKKKDFDPMFTRASSESRIKEQAEGLKGLYADQLRDLRTDAKKAGINLDDPKVFQHVVGMTYQGFADRLLVLKRENELYFARASIQIAIKESDRRNTTAGKIFEAVVGIVSKDERRELVDAFEKAGNVVAIDAYLGRPSTPLSTIFNTPLTKLDQMREESRFFSEYHPGERRYWWLAGPIGHNCTYEQPIPPDYQRPNAAFIQKARDYRFDSFDKLASFYIKYDSDITLPDERRIPGTYERLKHALGGPAPDLNYRYP